MRKIRCLFIICFLSIQSNSAQTRQDSITAFKKVNKWAVVKLTIAYMEDLRNWSSETDKSKLDEKFRDEFEDYKNYKSKYDEYVQNIDLEKFRNSLKNNWPSTESNVFQNYKRELLDSILVYNFENILFVPEKSRKIKRLEAISEIRGKFISILPKDRQVTKKKEVLVPTSSSRSFNNRPEEISLLNMIVYIVLAVAILLVLFLAFALKKVFKELDYLKRENKKAKILQVNPGSSSKNSQTIENLKRKIQALEKENTELSNRVILDNRNSKIDNNEKPIEDKKSVPLELSIPKNYQSKTKLIYFPSPFENNRFANEDLSETQVPFSLYVAEIEGNTNRGSIRLIETANLSRALNSPNTFLEPVCNYENAYSSSAKEIKVIAEGYVVLEGEDWVVKTKIKIKFI